MNGGKDYGTETLSTRGCGRPELYTGSPGLNLRRVVSVRRDHSVSRRCQGD